MKLSWREDARILRVNVLPVLGAAKAPPARHRGLAGSDRRAGADHGQPALALLRRLFNSAAERGLLEASPCTHIKAPRREKPASAGTVEDEFGSSW